MEDGIEDLMFDRLGWKIVNTEPNPLPSLRWDLSHVADAPQEKQPSRGDNLTEHSRSHYSGGAIGASVLENRKSHGLTPYDEDMGSALHDPAQKAALASPRSNASGPTPDQSGMSSDASLDGDGELREETNFNKFSKAVLGDPAQYAVVPAFSRPTGKNGEPITLGIILAARALLLEEVLKREGQSCHQSGDMPQEPGWQSATVPGINVSRTHTAFIYDILCKFLYRDCHDSDPAFLELMSERNFAANTIAPSALPASSPTQSESQNPDSPSDLDSSSRREPITARDSLSSREPTPVPKPQKNPVHSCPTCAKHFSRSSTLARHAKSHRGVKDYKCTVCLRAFSRKDLLNRHMSLHDRGVKWVCGGADLDWGCGREFSREHDLKRHFGSQKGQLCRKLPSPLSKQELADLAYVCRVDNE